MNSGELDVEPKKMLRRKNKLEPKQLCADKNLGTETKTRRKSKLL
jgi:hypothetical protein